MTRTLTAFVLAAVVASNAYAQDASVAAEGVAWKPFEEAVEVAKERKKKVLIDVWAVWCPWCERLQHEVYADEVVQAYLAENFVATRLDAENQESIIQFMEYELSEAELALGLGAQGFPTTIFLDSNSDYITRLPGFVDPAEFMTVLSFIGSEAFRQESYEDFRRRSAR